MVGAGVGTEAGLSGVSVTGSTVAVAGDKVGGAEVELDAGAVVGGSEAGLGVGAGLGVEVGGAVVGFNVVGSEVVGNGLVGAGVGVEVGLGVGSNVVGARVVGLAVESPVGAAVELEFGQSSGLATWATNKSPL